MSKRRNQAKRLKVKIQREMRNLANELTPEQRRALLTPKESK